MADLGSGRGRHVFYDEGSAKRYLQAIALRFALDWDPRRSMGLRLDVMRVERHTELRDQVEALGAFALAK